jgi:hypothetical protein
MTWLSGQKIARTSRLASGGVSEDAASAAGTTRFASLRQFSTRAEPAGARLRGDGVSAPPHAPLFRERRSGLRLRRVPRAEGSTADRKPTAQVGALFSIASSRVKPSWADGVALSRGVRADERTRTPLVAHTRRVDDEPRANANLLTDWAQPNGWELTRIDFVILALTRTRRFFFFALRARPKCGRDGGCGIR